MLTSELVTGLPEEAAGNTFVFILQQKDTNSKVMFITDPNKIKQRASEFESSDELSRICVVNLNNSTVVSLMDLLSETQGASALSVEELLVDAYQNSR